jgi:hypothetical protein
MVQSTFKKNAVYLSQLTLDDLDKDGKEEIIVQLCKGYGTGMYDVK